MSHRVVADIGNTRLKLARVTSDGALADRQSFPLETLDRAGDSFDVNPQSSWAISSVNPAAASALADLLRRAEVKVTRWFRSAADVPLRHALPEPSAAGADRALAVLAGLHRAGERSFAAPGIVVACGTALTVDHIDHAGVWIGGAIAPGLGLMSRAMHTGTAQLPEVVRRPHEPVPPPWGSDTRSAIEAGLYGSVVGAARELINRQRQSCEGSPWIVWTGGDARWVASAVDGPAAWIEPDLVLQALARLSLEGAHP